MSAIKNLYLRIRRRFGWFHWIHVVLTFALFCLAFAFYLQSLYHQLETSFSLTSTFVPTRIYSDVSRIAPPQPRSQVESRLRSLGYAVNASDETVHFKLHTLDYPPYLIPENHPTLDAAQQEISFNFSGTDKDAVLQSIQIGSNEVPDFYLEPEPVAILSRGGIKEIRDPVKFADVPAQVWQAIIAIEDQHFLEHKGFDPRGLARAIFVNLKTLSFAQGGSTLTQQLVKNLMARRTKNVFQKVNELFLSLILETQFDKERILERYLNEVYLGQVGSLEIHGVAEGAELFFGKKLDELNLAEIALMAGVIRGPYYYSPYRNKERAFERQRLVLKKMAETGQIAEGEAIAAAKLPVRLAPPRTVANKAPFFTDFVKAELIRQLKDRISEEEIPAAGFRVYTTLDMTMNSAAQRAVTDGVAELEKKNKMAPNERLEGALAAVDHTTGFIRALVGGRSYAQSNFNRILNMRRQVGSTFKPFVYLTAFQKGADPKGIPYGPGHPVEDAPWKLTYDHGRQSWAPKNYEKKHLGWISFRTALANSINTVAARLGVEVGIPQIIETARALGIESELPAVPALSLGVAELSPVDLLRAYATIANHGIQDELTVIRGITQDDGTAYARFVYHPKQAYLAGPTDLLTDMMQNVFIDGTARAASAMGFDRPAAGKTGTTSQYRDAWFAGFTPQLTTVVWVGMDQVRNDIPTKIKLTGANSALPIWVNFMKEALAGDPPTPFPQSAAVTSVRIDEHTGRSAQWNCPSEQVKLEKYVTGLEPQGNGTCESVWPPSEKETVID